MVKLCNVNKDQTRAHATQAARLRQNATPTLTITIINNPTFYTIL